MSFSWLHFIDAAVDYGREYELRYHTGLMIMSYLIAATASSAALVISNYMRGELKRRSRRLWLLAGAIAMGTGVWLMHFVGMLAVELPVPVSYDTAITAVSLIPAVIAGLVCLLVINRDKFGVSNIVFGGVAMALGISTMHYIGMAAMRLSADMRYDPYFFVISILIATVLAVSALYLLSWAREPRFAGRPGILVVSGAVMGLAITGMHHMAKRAVHFFPVESAAEAFPGIPTSQLAVSVYIITLAIVGLAVPAAVLANRFIAEKSLRDSRDELQVQVAVGEAELELSRAHLLEAQKAAKIGSWKVNMNTNEVWWSDETIRMFGDGPETFKPSAKAMLEKIHPDNRKIVSQMRSVSLSSRKPVQTEYRIVQPDGSMRTMRSRGAIEYDAKGLPSYWAGTVEDISEQMDTEKALAESEAKYRMIADAAQEGICVEDADARITYINRRMEEMLGYSSETLLGRSMFEFLGEDARQDVEARMAKRRTGISEHYDLQMLHKDGSEVSVSIAATPIYDEDGNFDGALAMVSDISSRRKLEEQLRQAQKMEAVGQLTGGIAHDFNNLLTVIIGNLQLLEEEVEQNDLLSSSIKDALDAGLRGADLTRRLLAFSRQQLLTPKVTAVDQLLLEIEPLLRSALGEGISLGIASTDNLWLTKIDLSELENAVVNLCINSRDAMTDGGQVNIETSNRCLEEGHTINNQEVAPGEYVLLTVSDNGEGMNAETLKHVFEPFFSTKEIGKGSGLGLSMVYGFVTQSQGHIDIESEEGHGTAIRIYLPRAEAGIESKATISYSRASVPEGNETVLVVEDEVAVRRIAVEILSTLGYHILEAGTAAEALAVLEDHDNIDVMFSDVLMPGGMTGIELARQVHKSYPNLKVLLTTGFADTASFDQDILQGGDDILRKPYQRAQLAQTLREVLDRK